MTQDSASYIQGRAYFSDKPLWNAITEKQRDPTFYGDSSRFKLTIKNNHEGIKLLLFDIFEIFHNKISINHV